MIINLRGTSGSGKTTLVNRLIGLYGSKVTFREEGRKQPIGYVYRHPKHGKQLALIGHYETPCGGCDTIPNMDKIFTLVRQAHEAGYDVLFEGLLISAEIRRALELHQEGLPLIVVELTTPVDLCVESVNLRRIAKKGDAAVPLNPKNTVDKAKGVRSSTKKLQEEGVRCVALSREEAFKLIKEEFRL